MGTSLIIEVGSQEYLDTTVRNLPNPDEITFVCVTWSNIWDLRCLSRLCNLRELKLSRNSISDLEPLSTLVKLQKLNLYENCISNIEALSHLGNLQELILTPEVSVELYQKNFMEMQLL